MEMARVPLGTKDPNGLYLGGIDANREVEAPNVIRKTFLWNLMFWDHIILSDAQILTDPRINHMISDEVFCEEGLLNRVEMQPLEASGKGFEKLIQSELVRVALRMKGGEPYTMERIWKGMAGNDSGEVPHLPKSPDYARFLDQRLLKKEYTVNYDLGAVGAQYGQNLREGAELIAIDPLGKDLAAEFKENVLFRDLLEKLNARNKEVSPDRYNVLYAYLFGCYCVNVPKVIGCSMTVKAKDIPPHLASKRGDMEDQSSGYDMGKLRPLCVSAEDMNLLRFDEFITLRRSLTVNINTPAFGAFFSGRLPEKDFSEFKDVWNDYAEKVRVFYTDKVDLLRKKNDFFAKEEEKLIQKTILDEQGQSEMVMTGLSSGEEHRDANKKKRIMNSFSNRPLRNSLREEAQALKQAMRNTKLEKLIDAEDLVVLQYDT